MNQYLEKLQQSRDALHEMTDGLTVEQFNYIPEGYQNNIIWNMGHIITVSERILSKNSDFIAPVHNFDTELFGKNKKPEKPLSREDIDLVRNALLQTVSAFQESKGIEESKTMEISAGNQKITVGVLQFVLFHENVHYKTIEKMLQLVKMNKLS